MEKEKALEFLGEFEKFKESINKLDAEILNYKNASTNLNESSNSLIELSETIKSIIKVSEDIQNELFKISSEEVLNSFKSEVNLYIKKLYEFESLFTNLNLNISEMLKEFNGVKDITNNIILNLNLLKKNQKQVTQVNIITLVFIVVIAILQIVNYIL